jgi:hypothetical protein
MSWIKRNLYFVIGSLVAVALLVLAGVYCYSKWALNNHNQDELVKAYAELKRINDQFPGAGNDRVDNIAIARDQQAQLLKVIEKFRKYFLPILPIPETSNVSSESFAAALRRTVDELGRAAANANIILPPRYEFSFEAQRSLVKFAPGSLEPLAAQLGDVNAICNVLFEAKINALYDLRRERISADDLSGPQADYLEAKSVTNELAVLVPYGVTFYCFTPELSEVLAGFADSPHGFIVKTINIEPGMPGSATAEQSVGSAPYGSAPAPAIPVVTPGLAPGGRGGLPVVLDEKQLKIRLTLDVVKLQPKK